MEGGQEVARAWGKGDKGGRECWEDRVPEK